MPLLTTAEVAKLLRVHPKQVYRLLKNGLPARRVGSEWRYEPAEVMAWSRMGAVLSGPASSGLATPAAPLDPAPSSGASPPLVAANGDRVVMTLLRLLQEAGTLLRLIQADKETGLALLGEGSVIAAGSHAGGFPTQVAGERLARVHLVRREIGLVGRGEPPRLRELAGARFASRPHSAGVRRHLDDALAAEGLDPREIGARALLCASHLEVACRVARGERPTWGFASRAWAEELGLGFRLLAHEAYGLLVRARDLGEPHVVRLCEMAQGERFRREAAGVAGYDPAGAGDIKYDGGPLAA